MHKDIRTHTLLYTQAGVKIGEFGNEQKLLLYTSHPIVEELIRWWAPEVIVGEPFSLASDVWNFAIAADEIFNDAQVWPPACLGTENAGLSPSPPPPFSYRTLAGHTT